MVKETDGRARWLVELVQFPVCEMPVLKGADMVEVGGATEEVWEVEEG